MADIDPNRLYKLRCAACNLLLGTVFPRHADTLGEAHATKCHATIAEYDQALAAVAVAKMTGDTSELERRLA